MEKEEEERRHKPPTERNFPHTQTHCLKPHTLYLCLCSQQLTTQRNSEQRKDAVKLREEKLQKKTSQTLKSQEETTEEEDITDIKITGRNHMTFNRRLRDGKRATENILKTHFPPNIIHVQGSEEQTYQSASWERLKSIKTQT